uniref:chromate transporter n=1 Tax=Alistipes sp. TaxID=1872444 RepID=UPI00405743DD
MIFWQLFLSYLKIGFFGFGGGYAMLSLIYSEVVVRHEWLSSAEFADIVAISQITPGPIAINSATYVGYSVGVEQGGVLYGILGALITTTAVSLPSLTLMILITSFFLRLKNSPMVKGAMRGIRPVVIGLIASAVLLLMWPHTAESGERSFIDLWSWGLFAGVLLGCYKRLNPILLIILSAIAGILIYL